MHGLRSRGDMSFEEIDDVVVNMEFSTDVIDIYEKQPFQPQMYKTHFPYDLCPKGFTKYIVVTRCKSEQAVHLGDIVI